MGQDDRTTSTFSTNDAAPETSWFLIVSTSSAPATKVVPLRDNSDVVFGRLVTCDVTIDHEAVSRKHALIRRTGDQIVVSDLGSRNRTLVNGSSIEGTRRLTAGDVVSVGPATAVVAASSASRRPRQVATVGELEERLEGEVDRSIRYHRPLALVMLRFAGSAEAITAHVEELNHRLRRMDLLAEYGNDELALVLPETDRAAAEHVAKRARSNEDLRVDLGIATFPADGSHAGELISTARERLRGVRAADTRTSGTQVAVGGRPVVVADPLMKQVFELAKRVASSTITALVVGETGVGKEVVAEAVHRLSPRAAGPYVRLNCAALSESIVESELFGHEKGAFTGAIGQKSGFFEAASGGTLFLDEIGELPPATQAKLLRVLEQRRIVRVGGTAEISIDVRLVCATHRDLEAEVKRGRFREDLYFRISAFVIPVPPLRDRRGEIPLLAAQFTRELSAELGDRVAAISPEALAVLAAYDWPGNVRELRNVIERAVVMSERGRIELVHLPDKVRAMYMRPPGSLDVRNRVVAVGRDTLVAALEVNHGNQTYAARQLGISRFALMRLMDKYELKPRKP